MVKLRWQAGQICGIIISRCDNVPENLVALVPKNVTPEDAVFTVVGSIGLQGIRLLNRTFGETIVVFTAGVAVLALLEKKNPAKKNKSQPKQKIRKNV